MAWTNESAGRGWMATLGGSSADPGRARAVIVTSARRSRSSMSGIAAVTSAALNQRSGGGVAGPGDMGPIVRSTASRPVATIQPMSPRHLEQSLENLKLERDAIALYDALAGIEKDPRRGAAFRTIAGNERRHAEVWATKLRELGAEVPPVSGPRLRVRTIVLLARLFGTHAVRDLVQALEGDEEDLYNAQASPEVASIAADEREHAEIWKRLSAREVTGDGARSEIGAAADTHAIDHAK